MVAALACHRLSKTYGNGNLAETALTDVSLSFEAGKNCVLVGPSGSGKTTLLSILGCLLTPTAGSVELDGYPVNFGSVRGLVRLRRRSIGFVFQHAQLLPFLTVRENLTVVAQNARIGSNSDCVKRIASLLECLGIARYANRKPSDLSGGQRQRVAIARAILHCPKVILADEPTASLDWENGQAAMRLLCEQAQSNGALLVTVTHDSRLLNLFDRVIHLESGRVRPA